MLTEQVLRRICSEFSAMPGLRLTFRQVQRLWGLDEAVCAHALVVLVDAKFLVRTNLDTYGRFTERPVAWPRLRVAKAHLNQRRTSGLREVI